MTAESNLMTYPDMQVPTQYLPSVSYTAPVQR